MRLKAPFEHGSVYVDGKEVYIVNGMTQDIPECFAKLLMTKGYKSLEVLNKMVEDKVKKIESIDLKDSEIYDKCLKDFISVKKFEDMKSRGLFKSNKDYFVTVNNTIRRDDIEVSIIIPTMNRRKLISNCLKSVYENTHDITYEIVIVDGSNDNDSFKEVFQGASIVYLRELTKKGIIAAFNRGFENAMGEYTAWLNDDTIVEKDWLNIALKFMKDRKDVALGAMFHKEGAFGFKRSGAPAGGYIWDGDYCVRTLDHRTKHPNLPYANFGIIKTSLFKSMGFWNNIDYRSYVGDTELAHRIWESGMKVVAIPGCRLIHYYNIDDVRKTNVECYENERKFYERKWFR